MASEWRQERERAHADIMVEVAALGRAQVAGPQAMGNVSLDEQGDEVMQATVEGAMDETMEHFPEAQEAEYSGETGAARPPGDLEQHPGAVPQTEIGPEQVAAAERGAQAPPLAGIGNDAHRQHASLMRTWCAKLGTAVAIQGVVQFLAGRVSFDEVALWRMQTASCAWHSGRWDDIEANDDMIDLGHSIAPSLERSQQRAVASRGARVLRFLTGGWNCSWKIRAPDSATVAARRDWSRDLHDDAFEIVAANSFIWNRALRPIIGIGMAQLLCAHCPKQLWAKIMLLAIPILRHPLKVVSLRLVCPGWPPPSFWQLILDTLDGPSKMSPMAGILPKICSHFLIAQLRSLHLDEKIRLLFMQVSSVGARAMRSRARSGAEQVPAPDQPQSDGTGGRQRDVADRDRGVQRGAARGGDRHLAWAASVSGPLQRVVAAMFEELLVATVTYPLVVLERRMCVDLNAPSNPFSLPSNLLYTYRLMRVEGWSALTVAYPEAMLVTVGKFSIYCTQLSIEEIVSRWFGPFGRLMLPAASAALAAGSNALRTMSSSHIKRAPWNSVLSVMLWMECGALASCYKQLGNPFVHLDQQGQRALRFWGWGGANSGEGRNRGLRLPLVRFRSDEARAQWFSTAYGSLDALSERAAAQLAPETSVGSTWSGGVHRRSETHAPGEPTDTYLQRSFPTMEPARVRDIASQDSGMIRSTGMPSMFSEVRSESDTFERMGNTKHVVSRWGRQRPSGRPLPELRTIVTQQAPYTSSNKVVMDSCAGTELARTMWSLRTLQLRSPEFSRNLPLSLTVDPDDVLASSFALLESLPAEVLVSRPIFVRFKGQIGSDWGGVRRAWMAKLASELFDPGLGLVIPCSVLSASTGVSPTGNITINPAPELLYTDQSASKSKITREEKREEKRENLRALLEGERRGIRDRDRERRRDTLSVQASVCGGGSASRPDASERAAAAGGACDAATLMAAAAEDNGECRDHRNESGDWSACAADACSESCVRDEASESDMDRGTERPVDDVTGGHMPGGIVEVAREDADVVSAECRQEGSLDSTIAPPGPAAAGGSASEAFAAGEGGQFIGGDGEARDAGSAGGEVNDASEKKGGSSNEGAVKDKSITDRYLRFMGRVLGIALLSGDPLGVNLDSAFFHSLLSREPLRIVLLGPPGCGKSLQCNLLASRCRLRHVTLDRLVRWHSTHNTREFKELKKLLRSANLRSTSARAAAEGLLLALHPPERAASPLHDKEDAALRGDGAHKSQASARTEERMFRKAHEIVLGMLKTRLAPRRRAGDKGWVLEGLPHCVSLAGELWDLGESCQPNLVVALHPPQKQRNEGGPLPESHVSPLSRPCSPDTVAQPDAVDRDLDARMVDDAGAAKGAHPSTGPISASVEQFGNVTMSCENCRNDLEFGQKICSFCGDPAPRAWPASCGEDDDLTGDGQKFGRQCGAEAQGGAGGVECHNLPSSCDAASELESCREPVLAEGIEATPTQDRHTGKNKLSDFSNTLGEHAGGAEACGAKARRRPHDAQMAEAGERDPVDPRRDKGQRVDECRKRTVLEEHYARNIWGVLDFYHSHTVTCAMINQASHDIRDELEVDGDQSNHLGAMTSHSGGDDVKDDEALLSTDSTSGAIGLTDGRTLRDEDMEAGPGRSWFLDGWAEGGMDDDDWVQVNREGLAEGSSSATASVAAAGQACCGNVPGGELSVQHRTHSACRNNNLDFGESTERRFGCGQRASYMSPPHLHKEIMRVVGLVQWGAPGVSEPGLAELAQTDPDEYEKLQRLLSMDKNECAAWLEAGDMPFTTATKEARVAPSVGLPLSALDRLDTAPLGGYTPHDRVTPETVSDYAALVCHRRMVEDVAHQMAQIRHGFEELAPRLKLGKMITARELETVLVGSADVDVSDWRQHSVAKGFTASAPQVEWFWEVLKEASAETRLRILTWTTGLARAPLGGFAHMHLAFTLQCDPAPEHADRLPVAHTCGLQLDLPLYASKEVLCSKLLQAVQHVDFQIA